jgi:hypothetical protein
LKFLINLKFLILKLDWNKWLWVVWLLLVPTQLGKHFWPEWSLVAGVRVDYLSPTLYLGDIIWVLLVIFNLKFVRLRRTSLRFEIIKLIKSRKFWVGVVLVVINILVAGNRWEAIYRWIRIGQVLISLKFIKFKVYQVRWYLLWIIPIWIVVESWLGLAQVVNGGSLGGIWWWLGERRFALGGIGLAEWQVAGENIIRAYGTFSHPNSLAGFLLVSLIYWLGIYESRNLGIKNFYKWTVLWSGVLGIVLSGSRVVWGVGIIILIISNFQFLISKKNINLRKIIGYLGVGSGVIILILGLISINYRVGDFVGGWDRNSIDKRLELARQAGAMIKLNPLFGVGAGNFLVAQPRFEIEGQGRWRQPVHNIFLLWLSEMGIIITIYIIHKLQTYKFQTNFKKQFPNYKLVIMGVIAITGMVDHYWLTLPQNWWLLAIMLAV